MKKNDKRVRREYEFYIFLIVLEIARNTKCRL